MSTSTLAPTAPASLGTLGSPLSTEPAPGQILPGGLQHLGLVLWVSLSIPIAGSAYYLVGGTVTSAPMQQQFRLLGALLNEATSLAVLWYVICRQGKTLKDIGWTLELPDIPRALGLLVASSLVTYFLWIPVQYLYRVCSGHFLATKSLGSVFGFGISFLSVAFICLNPFFEELIVRAYTMSEVMSLGGSRGLAVIVSVAAQVSYHLYQGLANVLALTFLFTIFSIYYARTRRIAPLILAHLGLDLFSLVRGTF